MAPVVTDSEGNEVTGQFDLSLQTGKLIINKRSIILTSADDEKEYDRLMAYNTIKLVKKLGFGNTSHN